MADLTITPIGIESNRLAANPNLYNSNNTRRTLSQNNELSLTDVVTQNIKDKSIESEINLQSSEKARAHGVLRLLNEGHSQGVADVRLRINFFDQLSTQSEQAALTNLEEHSTTLIGSVNDSFIDTVAPLLEDEETQATFNGLLADFESSLQNTLNEISINDLDSSALESTIQSAFDSFIGQLSSTLSEPTADSEENETLQSDTLDTSLLVNDLTRDDATVINLTPTEETIEISTTESTLTLEDAISSFAQAFSQALSEFISSFETSFQQTTLSSYNGNGSAYDKFLSIYNDLYGISTVDELV